MAAFVALAVGGAALVSGVGFGLAAMHERSELDRLCPNHLCPGEERDRLNAARSFGIVSTLSFVTSVAALGAGTYLFFDSGATADREREPQPARASAVRPRLRLGLTRAELSVHFE